MGTLSGNVRAAVELLSSSQDPSQPIFQSLSPVMFGQFKDNSNILLTIAILYM